MRTPAVLTSLSLVLVAAGATACGASSHGSNDQPACTGASCPDGGVSASSSGGGSDPGGHTDSGASGHSDAGAADASTGDARADAEATPEGGTHAPPEGGAPGAAPGFPRLGSLDISTVSGAANGGYDVGFVQWASKIHVNVIGANWTGAGSSLAGGSRGAFVDAIHAQSTIGARVIQYFDTDGNTEYWPLASVSNFILYQHGTSGPCTANSFAPNFCNTNQTLYPPADANGLHLEGEAAQALVATLVTGTGVDAAPHMDGTFHDNMDLTPSVAGDYQRNGTQELADDPTAGGWLQAGFAEGFTYQHAHSSLITIGNMGGWGITGGPGGGTDASGLAKLVQGGIIEGVFGDSWSVDTWSGFALAKTHYQFCMANSVAPRLVLVHHSKLLANGSDPTTFDSSGNPTAYGPSYQAMRYGVAFTLMDDGYYATTQDSNYFANERNWFDEYAVDPVTGVALAFPDVDAGLGYLGQPTDAAWPAPLASGVYERHFANAATGKTWLVLVNPKGNGMQTVTLAGTAKKLTGTQAPAVNDGSMVTSVTLKDRDGLIVQMQ